MALKMQLAFQDYVQPALKLYKFTNLVQSQSNVGHQMINAELQTVRT